MKRTALRPRRPPITRRDFDYAALHDDSADTFADRISEELLDTEDERMAVEVVLRGMIRDLS